MKELIDAVIQKASTRVKSLRTLSGKQGLILQTVLVCLFGAHHGFDNGVHTNEPHYQSNPIWVCFDRTKHDQTSVNRKGTAQVAPQSYQHRVKSRFYVMRVLGVGQQSAIRRLEKKKKICDHRFHQKMAQYICLNNLFIYSRHLPQRKCIGNIISTPKIF